MSEQRINLRNKTQKIEGLPIKPQTVDVPGFKGTLPFQAGRPIISEKDKNKKGQSVPKEIMEMAKKAAETTIVTSVAKELPKFVQPPVVNFDDLPQEKQEELTEAIKKAKTQKYEVPFVPRGPGIKEAINFAEKVTETIETQPQETKEVKPQALCSHCGWPTDVHDHIEPTSLDKQTFVVSILSQKRFVKEYFLFDNKCRVVFRTLTVEENDLVIKQLMDDWNSNKISGPAHSVLMASMYQMILGLEIIEISNGTIKLPCLDTYDYDPPEKGTILPEIQSYVYKTALPNESLRRIIGKLFTNFQEVVSKLEAMAESPDFWKATGESD